MSTTTQYDVAIIGGGPAGCTTATLLRKYNPSMRVAILERENFPREHIGESQLPVIGDVLEEMGCWDKVEAQNFPIKIGVTFRWGRQVEPWDFEFMPVEDYKDEPRPRKYVGQARRLAFQVDRARYDKLLLDHARECGVRVREGTRVDEVLHTGDTIDGFRLEGGEVVTARHYVDASGANGIVRRALGVPSDTPTKLMNIAIWDYWENAEWGEQFGRTATRVLVMSLGFGWIWFIPIGATRTSIGLICPQEYFKECGKSAEQLYAEALASEPVISTLTRKATRENVVRTTRDWSYLSERMAGRNWFLAGEAAGFADPILSAGMTLAHTGARELAYTILELDRGEHEAAWLRKTYEDMQRQRIGQHIRFADFWYSANGIFTDLKEWTRTIAQDAGLEMTRENAFHWLATGGFTNDFLGQVAIGGLDLSGTRGAAARMLDAEPEWELNKYNVFELDVSKARVEYMADHHQGRIQKVKTYVRGGKRLPVVGLFAAVAYHVERGRTLDAVYKGLREGYGRHQSGQDLEWTLSQAMQVLESLLNDKWVIGSFDPRVGRIVIPVSRESDHFKTNRKLAEKVRAAREAALPDSPQGPVQE